MNKSRILAIDGGGIRGIVSARVLTHLRKVLDRPVQTCFDVFAGTSTGSLLAASLAGSETECEHLRHFYLLNGAGIFAPRRGNQWNWPWRRKVAPWLEAKYDLAQLKKVLTTTLSDVTFSDVRKSGKRLIIPTFDIRSRLPLVLDSDDDRFDKVSLYDACCASCAAPTYFPAYNLRIKDVDHLLVDGGVSANDPAAIALSRVSFGMDRIDARLVSIGTGEVDGNESPEIKDGGKLQRSSQIFDVLFRGSGGATQELLTRLLRDRYRRIQIRLPSKFFRLDNAAESNVNNLDRIADTWCRSDEGTYALQSIRMLLQRAPVEPVLEKWIGKKLRRLSTTEVSVRPLDKLGAFEIECTADALNGTVEEIRYILELNITARSEWESLRERLSPEQFEFLLGIMKTEGFSRSS